MNNNNDFNYDENNEETSANQQEIGEDNEINQENTEEESEGKKKSVGREFLEWLQAIVIAVVIAMVVRNFRLFTMKAKNMTSV